MAKGGDHWTRLKGELADAKKRILELERTNADLLTNVIETNGERAAGELMMRLPIDPLPADYRGLIVHRVDARLHGQLARNFTAIWHHMRQTHETVIAPAYCGGRVHVDQTSQCLQRIIEMIELDGAPGRARG